MKIYPISKVDEPVGDWRWLLPSVMILGLLVQTPYLSSSLMPFHDTLIQSEIFTIVYNGLRHHHEIAWWFPYGEFGMVSDFLLWAKITPMEMVTIGFGLLADIDHTLPLFKAAVFLEIALFLYGMTRLSMLLYHTALTRLVIPLSALLMISWMGEIALNFHAFYALPLVFCYLVRFFREGKAHLFWIAALCEVVSFIGNVSYVGPLHMVILALFVLPRLLLDKALVRALLRIDGVVAALMVVTLTLLAVESYFVLHSIDGYALSHGRDVDSGLVHLNDFLQTGRPATGTALFGFLTGGLPMGNNSYYVGLLPFVLFWLGLPLLRDVRFWGFAAGALMLIWLAVGGAVATLLYHYMPTFNMLRHIGLFHGITGLLILLAAGFTLDHVQKQRGLGRLSWDWKRFMVLLLLAVMMVDLGIHEGLDGIRTLTRYAPNDDWHVWFLTRAAIWQVGLLIFCWQLRNHEPSPDATRARRRIPALILICVLLDMGSFALQNYRAMPPFEPDKAHTHFTSRPLQYHASRPLKADTDGYASMDRFLQMLMRAVPIHYNNTLYDESIFLTHNVDPCLVPKEVKTFIRGKAVQSMLDALFDEGMPPSLDRPLGAHRHALQRLGCQGDKLLLTDRFAFAATPEEAQRLLRQQIRSGAPRQLLLQHVDKGVQERMQKIAPADASRYGSVKPLAFSFNSLVADVQVNTPHPLWLLYRDGYHPDWRATSDGQPTAIYQADIGFKALLVEPGRHRIRFFLDRGVMGWLGGLILSVAVVAGVVGLLFMIIALIRPMSPSTIPARAVSARGGKRGAS